jgi:phosphoribosyl 1,2-cyclic phosphate phosphodiesterase
MKGKLIFLGTGGSVGVPVIGCPCEVCHSNDPINKRLRPSALLRIGHRQFLIDAGPDFRMQALRLGITKLDGLLLTHAHHDHTAGIDDLRPIYYRRQTPLPVLLSSATAQDVRMRYYYLFESIDKNFICRLHFQFLDGLTGSTIFEEIPLQYVTFMQGGMLVNGYRIGDLAYLSDIRQFPPSIFDDLKGVRYLIISALRYTPSPLHFSVDEAIDFANQLKAEKVWLTHISHELEHYQTNAYLPPHMRLAYDGLEIDFD